jgi:hypothetical protein
MDKMYQLAENVEYIIDAGCPVGDINMKINLLREYGKSNFKLEKSIK